MFTFTRYTTAIDRLYANLDRMIEKKIFSDRKVYVYGSGKIDAMIISYLQKHQISVCGIIDNNQNDTGALVCDCEIFSPEICRNFDDSLLILIASDKQEELIEQLENMGYRYKAHIFKVIDLPAQKSDYSCYPDRSNSQPLDEVQVKESRLKVLRGLKRVCERENLRYFLAYGTLLGAVKNKGFLSGDPTISVLVPVADFYRLTECIKSEKEIGIITSLGGQMDYFDVQSLMYDCSTIADLNCFPMQISAGVAIRLFPLYGLPDTQGELNAYLIKLKSAELAMANALTDKNKAKRAAKDLFLLMENYPMSETKFAGNILSSHQLNDVHESACFQKSVDVEFAGELFNAPAGYQEYLKKIYGNLTQLPPEEKRQSQHSLRAYQK